VPACLTVFAFFHFLYQTKGGRNLFLKKKKKKKKKKKSSLVVLYASLIIEGIEGIEGVSTGMISVSGG